MQTELAAWPLRACVRSDGLHRGAVVCHIDKLDKSWLCVAWLGVMHKVPPSARWALPQCQAAVPHDLLPYLSQL